MSENKTDLIDLDLVTAELNTFKIKLNDQIYELPRSVPLKRALNMMKLFGEIQSSSADDQGNTTVAPDNIEKIFDQIGALFQEKYPDITPDKLQDMITLQQAIVLMQSIVGEIFSLEEQQGNP